MERLTGLDALRGIAALVVLFGHLHVFFDFPEFYKSRQAVDFFFMLSGYVMARTYEPAMLSGPRFLWNRYLRFAPLAAIGTLIGLSIALAEGMDNLPILLLLGLLLLPNATTYWLFPLNPVAWSLFFELFGNFLHALLKPGNRLLVAMIFVSALMLLVTAPFELGISGGTEPRFFWLGFPRVIAAYFLGVLLFRLWRDKPPFRIPVWLTIALLPTLLVVPMVWWFDPLFVFIACPLLIAGGLRWKFQFPVLGGLSFPLYAVHYPLLFVFAKAGMHPAPAAVTCVALAVVLYLLERRGWLRFRMPTRQAT